MLGNSYFTPDLSLNTRLYYDTFYNTLIGDKTKCLNADGSASSAGFCGVSSIYDDNTLGLILTLGYDIYENANAKFGINTKKKTRIWKRTLAQRL